MQLDDPAETTPGRARRRQDHLGADLHKLPGPDDAGLDRADGLAAGAAVQSGRKRHLDERDHAVERWPETDIPDLPLQIFETVFKRETIIEVVRIGRIGAGGLGREIDAHIAGNGNRAQPGQRLLQIAETFAEGNGRRQGREVGSADGDPSGMAKTRMQADQPDRLAWTVAEKLVIEPGMERVEAGDRRAAARLQVFPALAKADPEIGRDAFRQTPVEADLVCAVSVSGRPRARRQAEFIRDKGIVGQDRRRKKTGAGETVRPCVSGKQCDGQRGTCRAGGEPWESHFELSAMKDRVTAQSPGSARAGDSAIGRSSGQASLGGPLARVGPVRLAGWKSAAAAAKGRTASMKTMRAAVSICGGTNPALACQRQHSEWSWSA